jgi:hypothetical protein
MVTLGFALRFLGFASKFAAMVAAPVVAVLAWGAVEDELDKRKKDTADATSS